MVVASNMDEDSNASVVDDSYFPKFSKGAMAARNALITKALSSNHRLIMAHCVA